MGDRGMTMQGLGAFAIGALAVIVAFTVIPLVGAELDTAITIPGSTAATGTVTFAANISNGTAVNLTDTSGFKYVFEFNNSGRGSNAADTCYVYRTESGCIPVNTSFAMGWNSTTYAAGNLSRAINNNATVSANVSATNTTTVVTITALTNGSLYNSMTLTSTGSSITVSGLAGGTNGSDWNSDVNTEIPTGVEFWESVGGILTVLGIVIMIGGVLQTIRGIKSG